MRNVTTIVYKTPDLVYVNTISHTSTCGEFLDDILRETREFMKDKDIVNKIDLFWHLDQYCEKTYGSCQWHTVSIDTLIEVARRPLSSKT